MDGPVVVVASVVVVQLVAWPLVGLLLARLVRPGSGRPVLPLLTVALLLASTAALLLVPGQPRWLSHGWFVAVPLLCATYPDGRFVPRWLAGPVAALVAVSVVDVVLGGAISEQAWWGWFAAAEVLLLLAPVHRYRRRATTQERLAVRWAVLGLVVQPLLFVLIGAWSGWQEIGGPGPLETAAAHLALLPAPVAFAVGLLHPRLADVDRLLRGLLAAVVVAAPACVAYVLVAALAAPAGPGRAAVLAATAAAALAVALVPLARWASGWLVFRGRGDAASAVRELGARLDAEPDPAAVPATFLRCVVDTAYLDGARLRGPGILDVVHGADPRTRDDAVTVPVTYLGGWLADLVVAPRRGETALTTRDQQVVARLAVHAAPALHGAVVMADLVVARSELVRAHEEERRRLRHDLHDDVGPALSGLALSAAALARRAADVDPALHALGTELVADIQGTVERTRALARGLRPAVLDDLGLAAAVRDRVRGLGGDDLTVQVDAPDALPLPAAVDLAALRIVQEAVTNVHRHAGARTCVVALRVDGGALHVVVDDDGSGLPEPLRPGVGLASIRDRAAELGGGVRLGRSDLGGTRLAVRLPVGVAT